MASKVEMRVRLLLGEYYPHEVLYAVAEIMRERAAEREAKHSTDPAFNATAADYRSIAEHVTTAASMADDLVR